MLQVLVQISAHFCHWDTLHVFCPSFHIFPESIWFELLLKSVCASLHTPGTRELEVGLRPGTQVAPRQCI